MRKRVSHVSAYSNIVTMSKSNNIFYTAEWDKQKKRFTIRLSGVMGFQQIDQWKSIVLNEADKIEADTLFHVFIDETGYEAVNDEVHHYKRQFLPEFLASYGYYLSLLPAEEIQRLRSTITVNKSRCVSMAMNHHKADVMKALDEQFGKNNERYFSDRELALEWLEKK